MIPTFKEFLETTGYQSNTPPVGSFSPSINLAGATSDTDGKRYLDAYGSFGSSVDPTTTSLGINNDEVKKGAESYLKQLDLPYIDKSGEIKHINKKTNPILILLSDGTRLYLPYDTYKKLGKPENGAILNVRLTKGEDDKYNIQNVSLG